MAPALTGLLIAMESSHVMLYHECICHREIPFPPHTCMYRILQCLSRAPPGYITWQGHDSRQHGHSLHDRGTACRPQIHCATNRTWRACRREREGGEAKAGLLARASNREEDEAQS